MQIRLLRAKQTCAIRLANIAQNVLRVPYSVLRTAYCYVPCCAVLILGPDLHRRGFNPISDFSPGLVSPQKAEIDCHKRAARREENHGSGDDGAHVALPAVDRRFGPTKNRVVASVPPNQRGERITIASSLQVYRPPLIGLIR